MITDAAALRPRDTMDAATQDPFEIMRMGEEMENQYLSDATGRLVNPDLWGPSIQAEIRKLAEGAGPEIQMRLEDLNCKFQEVTCRSILVLRSNITTMARTVLEILQPLDADNLQVQEECQNQLKDLLNLIWEEFQKQEQEYNTRLKKHAQEIVKLSDGSRGQIWRMALGGQGAVAAIFVTAVIGRLGWLGKYRPQDLAWTNFVNNWYKPDYQDKNGNLHYTKMTVAEGGVFFQAKWVLSLLCGAPFLSIFAAGFSSLWTFFSHRRKKELEILAKGENLVKSDLEKHKIMWHGVRMCIYKVENCLSVLHQLSAGRRMHRETAIKEMAQSLWSMRMAMDEMTVWMQGRGCFPPNFSIKTVIGAARHDVICGILNEAKAAQQALPDCLQQRIQG